MDTTPQAPPADVGSAVFLFALRVLDAAGVYDRPPVFDEDGNVSAVSAEQIQQQAIQCVRRLAAHAESKAVVEGRAVQVVDSMKSLEIGNIRPVPDAPCPDGFVVSGPWQLMSVRGSLSTWCRDIVRHAPPSSG